ncbi:MAG: hypothetical protein WD098_00200 [Balneolales bacterium]
MNICLGAISHQASSKLPLEHASTPIGGVDHRPDPAADSKSYRS